MEAVIVAGGLGSRLSPLTDWHPKHLLPVAGVPLLGHQLARLSAAGVEHVVLATSSRAGELEAALGDGAEYGVRLRYATEQVPLGTGGGIRNALDLLEGGPDDPVVVLNGDQLSDHDLAAQVGAFRDAPADVSLHLVVVADPRSYGCVPTEPDGRVTAFLEKPSDPVTRQVNAGCYVFRRKIIADIPAGVPVSVERETFPRLLRDGRLLVGHRDDGYWMDVGTPASLVKASSDLVRGLARSPALKTQPAELLAHPTSSVDETARVVGGSALGPDTIVGAGAFVDGSVLMAGAVVAEGAAVVHSALGPGARVGPDSVVDGAVLGDDAVVGARCELVRGIRVGCGVRIPDDGVRFSAG